MVTETHVDVLIHRFGVWELPLVHRSHLFFKLQLLQSLSFDRLYVYLRDTTRKHEGEFLITSIYVEKRKKSQINARDHFYLYFLGIIHSSIPLS